MMQCAWSDGGRTEQERLRYVQRCIPVAAGCSVLQQRGSAVRMTAAGLECVGRIPAGPLQRVPLQRVPLHPMVVFGINKVDASRRAEICRSLRVKVELRQCACACVIGDARAWASAASMDVYRQKSSAMARC